MHTQIHSRLLPVQFRLKEFSFLVVHQELAHFGGAHGFPDCRGHRGGPGYGQMGRHEGAGEVAAGEAAVRGAPGDIGGYGGGEGVNERRGKEKEK